MTEPILTLLTDFGLSDTYVAQMKGVILSIAPTARVIDATHQIPPQDVTAASHALLSVLPVFPVGTIHLCIVDPGVGSDRSFLLIRAHQQWIIAPDNGLLTPLFTSGEAEEIRELSETWFRREPCSHTFHGRDIVAPAGAHLALGTAADRLGHLLDRPPILLTPPRPELIPQGLRGIVVEIDHFGNLLTNLSPMDWKNADPSALSVRIAGRTLEPVRQFYSQVADGELLTLLSSSGSLEIACRNGNAANLLSVVRGMPVELWFK